MKNFKTMKSVSYKVSQTDFPLRVIRQLVESLDKENDQNEAASFEFERLSGRHFIHRIPVSQESKSNIVKRTCKVCSVAARGNDRRLGSPKRKRTGRETSYQCEQYKVAL